MNKLSKLHQFDYSVWGGAPPSDGHPVLFVLANSREEAEKALRSVFSKRKVDTESTNDNLEVLPLKDIHTDTGEETLDAPLSDDSVVSFCRYVADKRTGLCDPVDTLEEKEAA